MMLSKLEMDTGSKIATSFVLVKRHISMGLIGFYDIDNLFSRITIAI